VSRRATAAFRRDLDLIHVPMISLVKDTAREWPAGWCTYPDGFETYPDIEVFAGGDNEKMANAAAVWRQGNLLHFGFELTPDVMNETGRNLLLNSIAYISQFTEDRPIAVTPSVFEGNPLIQPRAYLDRRFKPAKVDLEGSSFLLAPTLFESLRGKSDKELKDWFVTHRSYLGPAEGRMDVDQDAIQLKAPISEVKFFHQTLTALKQPGEKAATAARLLTRYGPVDCEKFLPADWEAWFKENEPYLFFSDMGDYRWYIDPLAKKRRIPSTQLRGLARATKP
jgi:hypothetical protein